MDTGMEPRELDVLIVGAGPTGLALACDLARRGVNFRIVDKAEEPFKGSRAKGIQPRTQEVFDDLEVMEALAAAGDRYPPMCAHLWFFRLRWQLSKVRRVTPDVPYPNLLLAPQWATEGVLRDRLERSGRKVELGCELVELQQDQKRVTAKLRKAGGLETVSAKYLVGADGGRGIVRKSVGVSFEGFTSEEGRMIVADLRADGLSRDAWHVWPRAKGGFVGLCPLPHTDLFQLMMKLQPGDEPELSEREIQRRWLAATGLRSIQLRDPEWMSVFRPNVRLADRYRVGRVFLAGDAAHVHTPAGAQGLNTGVQDAYNLGWKLALTLRGAHDALLDTYEEERRPAAAAVLQLSTKLYRAHASQRPPKMQRGDEERQLALNYRGRTLASRADAYAGKLMAGDRAPDAPCDGPAGVRRLFDAFRGPHFTLLAFGEAASAAAKSMKWPDSSTVRSFSIISGKSAMNENTLLDASGMLRSIYGVKAQDNLVFLVRPDGYIGLIADRDWVQSLRSYQGLVWGAAPVSANSSRDNHAAASRH